MKITILGCGTSIGVPLIGCGCPVCKSDDPNNKRTRASVYVQEENHGMVIDTSADFRMQVLTNGITRVDMVLYTHNHADHTRGLDDLRAFNMLQKSPIPIYAKPDLLDYIKDKFDYCFDPPQKGGGVPQLTLNAIDGPFKWNGVTITPIPIHHGILDIYGFRINDFAYITDCSHLPDQSKELLTGLDLLILNALRHTPHPTHLSLEQSVAIAKELKPKTTRFTHLGHRFDYNETNLSLPPTIKLSHDGETFNL